MLLSMVSFFQENVPFFRRTLSSLISFCGRQTKPKPFVQFYIQSMIKKHRIDLSEFVVPDQGFSNYRDFHARELKPGMRSIDRQAQAIFPSDGFVLESGTIRKGTLTQVKGIDYTFDELINAQGFLIDPADFEGGPFVNLYLPIESYHRWHSPIDGHLVKSKYIHGDFLSLDTKSIYQTKKIFTRNERLVQVIENNNQTFILVAVGGIAATNIFSKPPVSLQQRIPIARAEELGGFFLGSSMVILSKKNTPFLSFTPHHPVKLGMALAP